MTAIHPQNSTVTSDGLPIAYVPSRGKPAATSTEELRARIPGWGADLDPADRPSVPRLDFREDLTGAHWEFPDRQPEKWPRERSVEHAFLTPVFGTAQPPTGMVGALRKYAYTYSEGRAAHWLLLIFADRLDAWRAHLASFATLHPDNPITETGVMSEFTRHGLRSRLAVKRTDVTHQWLDPFIVAGPWLVGGWLAFRAARGVVRGLRG